MTTRQLPSDGDIAALEFLGVGDIASEIGMRRGTFSMALHRHRKGESGGVEFPEPHVQIGTCSMWIRTAEVQAAIDGLSS